MHRVHLDRSGRRDRRFARSPHSPWAAKIASSLFSVSSGIPMYVNGMTSGRCFSGIRYVVVVAPLELTVVLMFCGGTMARGW